MDQSTNGPIKQSNARVEWVWYEGVDALFEGEGVCYNTNYGTAASADGRRCNRVERPSTGNNRAFAGVSARNYSAQSTGQFIEINCPGSKGVKVALGVDTVIDTGMLTFQVAGGSAAGRFVKMGFQGRGSIIPRQTVAAAVIEASMTGAWSLATDGVTLTMSDTTGLAAGDTVVILGSDRDTLSGVKYATAGKYVISSITSTTVVVLTASAAAGTLTAAIGVTGYAYTGNPTCQADLLDGEESGGVEFKSVPTAGTDTLTYMAGGVTYLCGTVILAADVEIDFAEGTRYGERKGFVVLGAYTTNDFVIDLVTAGFTMAGGALAEIDDLDTAGDLAFLVWYGRWRCLTASGGTEA